MQFTIHTGIKVGPFALHRDGNPRSKPKNIVKDNKSYLSNWTVSKISVPPKQIPIYVARNEKGEVTAHVVKARKSSSLLLVSQVTEEEAGKTDSWKLPIFIHFFWEEKLEIFVGRKI